MSMSPISSRKTVPRCATSRSPVFAEAAPVKAPFSWPKSSVSSRSRERAAQFTSTSSSSARGPFACSHRASTPLPVPVSPWMSTGLSEPRIRRQSSARRMRAGLVPWKGSISARAFCELPARRLRWSRWFCSSRSSRTSTADISTGLVRNCSAPSLIAFTAASMDPWAVRMMRGTSGATLLSRGTRSLPLPSGS